jgi:chromosome condensin MukBEF ATPase and DNA-binding subunit MukB
MSKQKNNEIGKIKLFISHLMNDEQDAHSELIAKLHAVAGKTKEYNDIYAVLTQIYDAKMEILNKIYKEMQGV